MPPALCSYNLLLLAAPMHAPVLCSCSYSYCSAPTVLRSRCHNGCNHRIG